MTLLMVWREGPFNRLWIVSDSRLSKEGESGGVVRLTDRAAKVLEIELILKGMNPRGPPIQTKILGFAYTGSSLIALQSYVAVLPLWSRLLSSGEQTLPTIGECADHLAKFVHVYMFEVAASGDFNCQTECILLGYNEPVGSVEAWRIEATPSQAGVAVNVDQIKLGAGEMALFGSGRADALVRLAGYKPAKGEWRREPIDMIREQLRDDVPGTVGGGVQIGMANVSGFELTADARFFQAGVSRAGDPLLAMHYRGFDLNEVSRVGNCFASLPGLGEAPPPPLVE